MSNRKKVKRIETDNNRNTIIHHIGKGVTFSRNRTAPRIKKKRLRKMQGDSRRKNRS